MSEKELAILRERARLLALPAPTLGLGDATNELLVFARGAQRYALDVQFVRELLPLREYTRLPSAPVACLGVAAARGELLALFDLGALDRAQLPEAAPHLMLLCGDPARELALAVDEAVDLVAKGPLKRPPEDHEGPFLGFDERGFLVLDGEALLTDPRLTIDPNHPEISP
jgi:chemotaxis signal transduction protein